MKTFTQLATGDAGFTVLSNNSSSANVLLGKSLINDQHRYLLQKYFDNERTFTTSTIGGQSLTLTGALIAGATSATISSAWTYPTCSQKTNFSSGEQRTVIFTSGSTAITWQVALTEAATSAIATVGVQAYAIPANISKIKNDTITVGQLQYQPTFVQTRADWDFINSLPYTSDIPNYCFIYNGNLEIFPIPSTTGNVITFNYKTRVPDLTFADYTAGTITSMAVNGVSVTGSGSTWSSVFPLNTDITYFNLFLQVTPPKGDGLWYPIRQFNSDTSLTLALPVVNAPNISSAAYTIGQLPLLSEDFHDMLTYGALKTYYASIAPDTNKFKEYDEMYKMRIELLEDYAGTKNVNVDLGSEPQATNPNLFIYAN